MANIQSQTKRNITNLKARAHHASFKASMRTAIKVVDQLLTKQDLPAAQTALRQALKLIDKSVSNGVQKKQTAARQKSQLMLRVNRANQTKKPA
jgi:small subunit ribosomal protein S20